MFNILNIQIKETLFLNDIHEDSYLIHKLALAIGPNLEYHLQNLVNQVCCCVPHKFINEISLKMIF
jgi:hypothetical protein